jgi:hypothetical protein
MLSVCALIPCCAFARSAEQLGWIQDRADWISNSLLDFHSKTNSINGLAYSKSSPLNHQNDCTQQ